MTTTALSNRLPVPADAECIGDGWIYQSDNRIEEIFDWDGTEWVPRGIVHVELTEINASHLAPLVCDCPCKQTA